MCFNFINAKHITHTYMYAYRFVFFSFTFEGGTNLLTLLRTARGSPRWRRLIFVHFSRCHVSFLAHLQSQVISSSVDLIY